MKRSSFFLIPLFLIDFFFRQNVIYLFRKMAAGQFANFRIPYRELPRLGSAVLEIIITLCWKRNKDFSVCFCNLSNPNVLLNFSRNFSFMNFLLNYSVLSNIYFTIVAAIRFYQKSWRTTQGFFQ